MTKEATMTRGVASPSPRRSSRERGEGKELETAGVEGVAPLPGEAGGLGVILNPQAGGNRRRPERAERLGAIVDRAGTVEVSRDVEDVANVVRRLHEAGIDTIAVCGGDGTVARTLAAAVKAWGGRPLPAIAPLRGGTMNGLADSLGLRRESAERTLSRLVAARERGDDVETVERELLRTDDGGAGFLFGAGVAVEFLARYYELARPGPGTAAALIARTAAAAVFGRPPAREIFRGFGATVTCDGLPLGFSRFTVLLAMTIEHLPLGFRAGYRALERPGHFHLLAGPISPARVVRLLPRFRLGIPSADESLHDRVGRELVVRFDEPTRTMIDAEISAPLDEIRLGVGPRVRFLRP